MTQRMTAEEIVQTLTKDQWAYMCSSGDTRGIEKIIAAALAQSREEGFEEFREKACEELLIMSCGCSERIRALRSGGKGEK